MADAKDNKTTVEQAQEDGLYVPNADINTNMPDSPAEGQDLDKKVTTDVTGTPVLK